MRVSLLVSLVLCGLLASSHAARPNIVLILADDLGYGDVSCYNPASKIITPHMDSLAREGMRFTDAYANAAVCTPTRYGLLTGRYCWRSRLKKKVLSGWDITLIEHNRINLAGMLKENGYATGCFGKWHLGLDWALIDPNKPTCGPIGKNNAPAKSSVNIDFTKPLRFGPNDYGFDESYIVPGSMDMTPYVYIENGMVENPNVEWKTLDEVYPGYVSVGFDNVETLPRFTNRARQWMAKRVSEEPSKPFFLYFPLTSPHDPYIPTPEFRNTSKAGIYGDYVLQTDHVIGEILKAIDSLGIRENTLLIVTSDNGAQKDACSLAVKYGHYSNDDLRGYKADTWEGGVRVPFFARWPGKIPRDTVSSERICLTDILATLAAIVGYRLPANAGEDSYSILPALLGREFDSPIREGTVVSSYGGGYAIIKDNWKFIDGKGSNGGVSYPVSFCPFVASNAKKSSDPAGQLYDLETNRQEKSSENQYAKNAAMRKSLASLLASYRSSGRSTPAVRNDAFFDNLVSVKRGRAISSVNGSTVSMSVTGSGIRVRGVDRYTLSIHDLSGRMVAKESGSGSHPVSISQTKPGIYLARISNGTTSFSCTLFLGCR